MLLRRVGPTALLRSQDKNLKCHGWSLLKFPKSSYSSQSAFQSEGGEAETIHSGSRREEYADISWDDLRFEIRPTDYMYVMKCSPGEEFSAGELSPYGNIELSPSSAVLNYGQGLFEGLKAYRKQNERGLLLFRPQENARRMQMGAERMCMPSPSVEQFVQAVKETVVANKRWVPPPGKGALYLRPLLIGSGAVLGLAPAPEYIFMAYASPVGNYFKEGLAPLNLFVDDEFHRATRGGTGDVKTITNYAPVGSMWLESRHANTKKANFLGNGTYLRTSSLNCQVLKAQVRAKSRGFSDVMYLDSLEKRYLEEVSSCNVFVVKDGALSTPATNGTILPGVTRKSVIQLARSLGFEVEERRVSIDELVNADEVFCTGTAVVLASVGSVTYHNQRYEYKIGEGSIARKLYRTLTGIQSGLAEDKMGWTLEI